MTEEITLYAALAKAQAEMPNAVLNKVNPHYKNKYADLAALRAATLPSLSKHGLCLTQFTRITLEGNLRLVTRLAHANGDFVEGEYPLPNMPDKPQIMGSALTYARRYGWGAILGEASEEDDDAERATDRQDNGKTKSAYQSRKDKDWETLIARVETQTTPEELHEWGLNNQMFIAQLPDTWRVHLREAYEAKMIELKEGVTEEGKPSKIKEQLKASLEAGDD